MNRSEDRVRIRVGAASLEIPQALEAKGQSIDSDSVFLQGPGMSIVVDQGAFSDRLTSQIGRPDYREETQEIAGLSARKIFYRDSEQGTYTSAVHIPDLNALTVVVTASDSVPSEVVEEVIRSIRKV